MMVLHLRKQALHDNPVIMKLLMDSFMIGLCNILIAGLIFIALPQMIFADEPLAVNQAFQSVESPPFETKETIAEVTLERPLVFENALVLWPDRDGDGLDDAMESSLAEMIRPFFIFDSNEKALNKDEPVTLFQVRPVDLSGPDKMSIRIRWVMLFWNNNGYDPCSTLCFGSHMVDIIVITCEMTSNDRGMTWETDAIALGKKETLLWKKGFNKITSMMSHPVIFISSGRHNPYFFPAPDGISSAYSFFGCRDNVDGKGTAILPDIKNVGEPEAHPEPDFANSLAPVFPDLSVWGAASFFSICTEKLTDKWLKNNIVPRDTSLCSIESLSSPGEFIRHKRYFGEVSKIISARDRLDARFRIIPAAGGKNTMMIESVNYPGYLLADSKGRIAMIKPGREEEKTAIIFKMEKGLKGKGFVSFESAGKKGSYIRIREGHLFVEPGRGKSFKKEASFRITSLQ
jgi:hypothetical protein